MQPQMTQMNAGKYLAFSWAIIHVVFFMIGGGQDCHGQADTTSTDPGGMIVTIGTCAEFPGGEKELYDFIHKNIDQDLIYSSDTVGMVIIRFMVDKTGQVTDIKVHRSLTKIVDDEVVRVVRLMPKWKPGEERGNPASVEYNLPVWVSRRPDKNKRRD